MTSAFPIKRLASVTLGKMVQPDSKAASNIFAPYLRAAHVQPQGQVIELPDQRMWFSRLELSALDLRQGDVVVVEGGAGYGRSAVLRDDLPGWGFQNSIVRLRPAVGVADGRFLDYALQVALTDGRIDLVTSTATLPHFTADKVSKFEVPSPPLDEQRAIADYLDQETAQIDALVAKQEEFIGLLRERRVAEIASGVELERPNSTFRRHVTGLRQGWSPNAEQFPADGVAEWGVLKVGCSTAGVFRPQENKKLPPDVTPRPENAVRVGELVISRSNTRELVGSAAVVPDGYPRLMLSDLNYGLTVASSLDPSFAAYALLTRRARGELVSRAKGTSPSMQKLAQRDVLDMPLWVPPIDEQREIVERLDAQTSRIDTLIEKAEEHIALAKERRSALITAAVTGQFDVRTARKAG